MSYQEGDLEFHVIDLGLAPRPREPFEPMEVEEGATLLHADLSSISSLHCFSDLSGYEDVSSTKSLLEYTPPRHGHESVATTTKNTPDDKTSQKGRDCDKDQLIGSSVYDTDTFKTFPAPEPRNSRFHHTRILHPLALFKRIAKFFTAFNAEESPKQVCTNKKSSALKHFAFFHLPAIIITILMLILYLLHFRWTAPHPTQDELSALQFAAKAHETFILTSLMDILYHRISYGLLYNKGISLGFLASPFSLGSPIQYLTSWEFWSAILYPASNEKFNRITGVLAVIIGCLAVAASPFSATVMIPRQGWWELGHGYAAHMRNLTGEYYIFGNPYPLEPDISYFSSPNWCEENSANCSGLDIGVKAGGILPVIQDPPTLPYLQNITYDNYGNSNNRLVSLSKANNTNLVLATCPMSFIAEAFSREYLTAKSSRLNKILVKSQQKNGADISNWKQPLLSVHCAAYVSNGEDPSFKFNGGFYDKYAVTIILDKEMGILKNFTKYKNINKLPRSPDPVFLNLRDQVSVPMSAAILFGGAFADIEAPFEKRDRNFKMKFDLCLIHARWIEAEVWQNYQTSNALDTSLGLESQDILEHLRSTSTADNIVNLTTNYLGKIGYPYSNNAGKFNNPVYRGLESYCIGLKNSNATEWDALTINCLTINLALYLTNALAQLMSLAPSGIRDDTTFLHNTYYEYVYGYDFQDSLSLKLAFAMLLFHVCIALIHIGIITLSRNPWYGLSWGSFGQMLVLALRSRSAYGLENAGAGVTSSRTWSNTVFVGDIKDKNILEMAIPLQGASSYLQGDEGGKRELLLRTKAGEKYS